MLAGLADHIFATADLQYIEHPAYNRDLVGLTGKSVRLTTNADVQQQCRWSYSIPAEFARR